MKKRLHCIDIDGIGGQTVRNGCFSEIIYFLRETLESGKVLVILSEQGMDVYMTINSHLLVKTDS